MSGLARISAIVTGLLARTLVALAAFFGLAGAAHAALDYDMRTGASTTNAQAIGIDSNNWRDDHQ